MGIGYTSATGLDARLNLNQVGNQNVYPGLSSDIRISQTNTGFTPNQTDVWDIKGGNSLTFKLTPNGSSTANILTLGQGTVSIFPATLNVGTEWQTGLNQSPIAANGSGQFVAFHAASNGSGGYSFFGTSKGGSVLQGDEQGNMFFLTKPNNAAGTATGTSITRMTINGTGNIGIGTTTPTSKLDVVGNVEVNGTLEVKDANGDRQFKVTTDGNVRARDILVDLQTIPDFVFDPNYPLLSLDSVATFIKANQHLPGIPSAKEYEERGYIELREMNLLLLQKVEELTLYMLQQQADIKRLETQIQSKD